MHVRPSERRVAFADESYEDQASPGFYVLAAAVFEPAVLPEAREACSQLSGPEDVEDDDDFGVVIDAEGYEPAFAELGLAKHRLVAAGIDRPGIPWFLNQPQNALDQCGVDIGVVAELVELGQGMAGQDGGGRSSV